MKQIKSESDINDIASEMLERYKDAGYHFQCTTCGAEWDETRTIVNGMVDFSDLQCPNGCNKTDDKIYWDNLEIPEITLEVEQ